MKRILFTFALLMLFATAVSALDPRCDDPRHADKAACQEPTTTTTVDTTTTTSSTTTTTTQPPTGLVIPPTQPYPARGSGIPYQDGGGYDIIASNADTGTVWWTAKYWGDNGLPYIDGATWVYGDRQGYVCGYGFITDANGEDFAGDNIVGRFAFVRPEGQAYGKVNDKYMSEAERYLDGTPTPYYGTNAKEIPEEDCTDVRSPIDYSNACRPVDERPRVGFFDGDGNVLDIRDYSNTVATNVIFNLHAFDGTTATVLACEDGQVGMIVYYDAMYDGQLAVDFAGTGPFGS